MHSTKRKSAFSLALARAGIPAHILAAALGVSVSLVHRWMLAGHKPARHRRDAIASALSVRRSTVDGWFR